MKFIYYLRYFFFIALNWNVRLAFFSLYHEIRGERKYKLDSIVMNRLRNISVKGDNRDHASIYQASNYYILEKGFDYLRSINENNNFTDFGCGKGRTLVVAAYFEFKDITGIDFAKALCVEAERNAQKAGRVFPGTKFNILYEDVVAYKIKKEQNVFFFFNPFDEVVMLQVVKNILSSLKEKSRKIYIMYLNPVHKEIFLSAGFEEEYYKRKLYFIELSILSNTLYDDEYADVKED